VSAASPLRVLLVEDDPLVSSILARVIAEATPKVVSLNDGRAALAVLRDAQFDMVISDLRMPGASGIEIAEWIRRERPETRVVVISGFVRDAEEVAILAAGARLLRKPFGAADLLSLLAAGDDRPTSP
jgi:DNA-binding response OmpR family regulator